MSWHRPTTAQEMADSTARGWSWSAPRFGLAGESVAVLSALSQLGALDRSHALSDHVATGMECLRDTYLSTGSREVHPSVCTYYVLDRRTGRVLLARQADGQILDELDAADHLAPRTRRVLRGALS